ncbi:odr-4-like protein [Chlorella sorokiniana]|uniref:Odr-4-like protein n=1 Tax=Chlorella sorokiniana TaxID=3076 RepID=A0A2P6U529_CHLSO|nr:odr-4-like protein [Chlorella sorokiniana]|eukprot:PRW61426.1 odr-4-like protein [Chlorella sorokiniana]
MVRNVQADAAIQQYAERCVQERRAAEVGALVGRVAPGKDLVLQVLRAPDRDGAAPLTVSASASSAPAGKKGKAGGKAGGGGGGLQLDDEWVVEHAAMIERLLPGGLDVVGLYVLCSGAAFAGATSQLAALADAAAKELSSRLPSLLLLHIDSVSGALTLREAAFGLRPAELKVAPLADQMVQLQSRHTLDLRLPVCDSAQELQAAFQSACDAAAARLRGALGLVAGHLATPDCQLADLDGVPPAGATAAAPVELLLQPPSSLAFCTAGGGKAGSGLQRGRAEESSAGSVALRGVLDCRACVHRREPAAAAVDAVAADVRRSLQARLDALLDAAEQQQEAAEAEAAAAAAAAAGSGGKAGAPASSAPALAHPLFSAARSSKKAVDVTLPRRAFVGAAAAGGIPFCDYLFEGESMQALRGRLQMLLPVELDLAAAPVECLETAAARPPAARAAASTKAAAAAGGAGRPSSAGLSACNLVTAGAATVGVLALALGYLSLGSGQ